MRGRSVAPRMLARGSGSKRVLAELLTQRTVCVSISSSIYWDIAIKESRSIWQPRSVSANVSSRYPLVLESVRYYDSSGKYVRECVSNPSELEPSPQ